MVECMSKVQYEFVQRVKNDMLINTNMNEDEAWDFGFRCWQNGYAKIDDSVENINKSNGWIDANDRLPENGVEVLVWYYNGRFETKGISYTWRGDWSGFINGISGGHNLRIIAWQPLPEDYKS